MAQRFVVCDVLLGGFNQWCFYTLWHRREKAVYAASQKDTESIILHYTVMYQHLEDRMYQTKQLRSKHHVMT